jgi:hypothetical protein
LRSDRSQDNAIDFLIAAVAASAVDEDVCLRFFDKDLLVICEHTGQPFDAESSAA